MNEAPTFRIAMGVGDCAAEYFPDRTDVQCLHRWQKVLNPDLVKGPWTKEVPPTPPALTSHHDRCGVVF